MVKCLAEQVKVFDALGDPTRFNLFQLLTDRDWPVSELGAELHISTPATLKHLQILEAAGLAKSEKIGRERRCQVDTTPLDGMINWSTAVRAMWNKRLDSLEEFLTSPTDGKES